MPVITIKQCLNCSTVNNPVSHQWLFEGMRLKELRAIKTLTGLSSMAFAEASEEGDPEALAAMLYILHKRDKITVDFEEIDLDLNDFDMKETEQEKKDRLKAEAEEKRKAARKDPKSQ